MVSDRVQRRLEADDVRFLIDEKLRPQGVVTGADGSSPPLVRHDPFLAFRYRLGVISERASGRIGAAFKPLFLAPVLILVLVGLVVADWWLFFDVGVAQALRQVIYHPGLFLPLLAVVVASAAFHEIGHASACRYGGARPGRMGCGLYLAWPAFYTDVSDAYRLNRRGRLRTDLGGVYFNVIIIVTAAAVYAVSHSLQLLVLVVVLEHMEIAHQLLPVIRLDGYYVVSDLTGVPDLFARIGPVLRGLLFWRQPDPRVTVLKRWVRAAVTAWVLIVVPLLLFELLIVLIHLPRILATSWDSTTGLAGQSGRAFGHGRILDGISDGAQIAVLAIPIAGILLMIVQLLRKLVEWAWRTTRGRPIHRGLAFAVIGAATVVLAFSWIPTHNYQPIGPGERGTQSDGLHALLGVIGGPGPLYSQQAAERRASQQQRDHRPPPATPPATAPPQPATTRPSTNLTLPHAGVTVPASRTVPAVIPPPTLPVVSIPPPTLPVVSIPPPTLPTVTIPPVQPTLPGTLPVNLPTTIPALAQRG